MRECKRVQKSAMNRTPMQFGHSDELKAPRRSLGGRRAGTCRPSAPDHPRQDPAQQPWYGGGDMTREKATGSQGAA